MAFSNVVVGSSKKSVSNINLLKNDNSNKINLNTSIYNVDYEEIDYSVPYDDLIDYNVDSNVTETVKNERSFSTLGSQIINTNNTQLGEDENYKMVTMSTVVTLVSVSSMSLGSNEKKENKALDFLELVFNKVKDNRVKAANKKIKDKWKKSKYYNEKVKSVLEAVTKKADSTGALQSKNYNYAFSKDSTWRPTTVKESVDYFKSTGGFKGMNTEIEEKKGGRSFWNLVKDGEKVSSVRGNEKYKVGDNLKTNVTLYSKGFWSEENAKEWFSSHMPNFYKNCIENEALSSESFTTLTKFGERTTSTSTYFNHAKISDGKIEYNLVNKEGSIDAVNKYSDNFSGSASVSDTLNILHADAKANASIGYDHVTLEAAASVSLISNDFKVHLGILELNINDNKLELIGVGVKGNVQVLEADAKASVVGGIYKGKDGKLHVDAGVTLEANAELVSASITGDIVLLGVDGSVNAKIKIGVGAQFVVGIQDGKLQFKIGIAVGVGVEFGGNIDISGLIDFLSGLLMW